MRWLSLLSILTLLVLGGCKTDATKVGQEMCDCLQNAPTDSARVACSEVMEAKHHLSEKNKDWKNDYLRTLEECK